MDKKSWRNVVSAPPKFVVAMMVAAAMVFVAGPVVENKNARRRAETRSVSVSYDTVRMRPDNVLHMVKRGYMTGGVYDARMNCAHVKCFELAPGYTDEFAEQKIREINDLFANAVWHEIRHAYNYNIMVRSEKTRLSADTHAYDEFFASVAGIMAQLLDMPSPTEKNVSFDVNYNIDAAQVQETIDMALACAYDKLTFETASKYEPLFIKGAKYAFMPGRGDLDEDTIRDSLRIFRINGKRVDVLDSASDFVRDAVVVYLNLNRGR